MHREVALISIQGLQIISNLIPSKASHNLLNLIENFPLSLFSNAATQKIGPSYSPDGPVLEFDLLGDRNKFINNQDTRLEIIARVLRSNRTLLRTHSTDAAIIDSQYFVPNSSSSLFSECTLSLNGEKISTNSTIFAHQSFIETNLSYGNDAKKHDWLVKIVIIRKTISY